MSVSLRTALVIQTSGNDIHCECSGQDRATEKFVGAIWLYHDGYPHELLADTDPIFDTAEIAAAKMEAAVAEIRKMDLTPEKQKLETLLDKG